MYCSEDKESVSDFISRSAPKIKKKYEFLLRFIADETNQLKESYVKHFSIERFKQFYELQLKAAKTMIRIIYYKADENIILLHAFNTRDKRDIAAILTFFLLPSINKGKNGTVKVIKLTQQVASGTKIEESTLEEKEVGGYGLPENTIKEKDQIIGKYSNCTIMPDDLILTSKLSDYAADQRLDAIMANGQILVTVSLDTVAAGVGNHLRAGDIVSVISYADNNVHTYYH